jgi:hypothetical protein
MRAILIDPEKRTVTEIQIDDDYRAIQAALQCKSFTTAAHLSGNIERGFDAVYASDDPLDEREESPRFWFQVDADRASPSSYPIAGLGLALGTGKQGEGVDVGISREELEKRIAFTRRRFRGFSLEEGGPGYDIKLDINAPIIDDE